MRKCSCRCSRISVFGSAVLWAGSFVDGQADWPGLEGDRDAVELNLLGMFRLSDAMISMQKSSIALQQTIQVRNKLVQAYQDIMNMGI